jgi:putative ABC transport system substrate-binding protein
MRRREVVVTGLAALALSRPSGAAALAGVGWLTAQRAPSLAPNVEAFRAGLAEHGYREGQNLRIEFRYGDDAVDRVPELAADLIKAEVSVIVAQGAAAGVAQRLNLPVPLVFVTSGDPITAGFADSLTRPRGNFTGMTFMAVEMNGKRLELLREMLPEVRRIAVIAYPDHPGEHLERAAIEDAGRRLGFAISYFHTRNPDELTRALETMAADVPQAVCVLSDGFAVQNRERIIGFGMEMKVPVVSGWQVFAQSGALFIYGPRLLDTYRRLAAYVDSILKGIKPSNLPIERPSRFEFVVNLRAAKALGLTVPESVLVQADEVIE